MNTSECIEKEGAMSPVSGKTVPPRKKLLKAASCDGLLCAKTAPLDDLDFTTNGGETGVPPFENVSALSDATPGDSSVVRGKVKLYESLVDEYCRAVRSLELKRKKLEPPPRRKRSKKVEHSEVEEKVEIEEIISKEAETCIEINHSETNDSGSISSGMEMNSFNIIGERAEATTAAQSSSEERHENRKRKELPKRIAHLYELFYRKETSLPGNLDKNKVAFGSLKNISADNQEGPFAVTKPPRRKSKSFQSLLTSTPTRENVIFINLELGVSPINTEDQDDPKETTVSLTGTPQTFYRHKGIRRPSGFSQTLQSRRCSFQEPVASYIQSENDVRSSSPVRASVSIVYVQNKQSSVKYLEKANSIGALTENEYFHVASLNAKKRQETKRKKKILKKRIQKAFKNTTACWPRSQKRKQLKRISSNLVRKKKSLEATESFASIFLYNDIKGSCTLPDDFKMEPVSSDIFGTDAKENMEFPPHVNETDFVNKRERRTLRERLLHPKMLGTFNSSSSLDSVALKKAQRFLLNSIHSSTFKSKSRKNSDAGFSPETATETGTDEASESRDTLYNIEEDVSIPPIVPPRRKVSVDGVPGAIPGSHSSKLSLKTRFFLRASSIPDLAPRIRKAFSKPTLPTTSECDHDAEEEEEEKERNGIEKQTRSFDAKKISVISECSMGTVDSEKATELIKDDKEEVSSCTDPPTFQCEDKFHGHETSDEKMNSPMPCIVIESADHSDCAGQLGTDAEQNNTGKQSSNTKKPNESPQEVENCSLSSNNGETENDGACKDDSDSNLNSTISSQPLTETAPTFSTNTHRKCDRNQECVEYSSTVVAPQNKQNDVPDSAEMIKSKQENSPSSNQDQLRTCCPLTVTEHEIDSIIEKITENDLEQSTSESLANASSVKQFAVKISPLSEESAREFDIDPAVKDERVAKTQRCVDTGRVVISYNAPVDGEHVTVNLLQINPDEIKSEIPSNNEDTVALQDDSNVASVSNATGGLSGILNDLQTSPCSDCKSPICNVPIIKVTSSTKLGNSTIPEQLHREITREWIQNQERRECFKNRSQSNLLRASGRRRIRANSIPECEELEDYDFKSIAIDDASSGQSPIVARRYESNILEVTDSDDFFDFFRDRAHDEHYAHILDSDSDNEEECAKAAVEYLLNARRTSVETLLTHLSDETSCNRSKRSSVDRGSFSGSNINSRRESLKEEHEEKIADDIFDYFGDSEAADEKKVECDGENSQPNITSKPDLVSDKSVSATSTHCETEVVVAEKNSEDCEVVNSGKTVEKLTISSTNESRRNEIQPSTLLGNTSNEAKEDSGLVAPEKPPRTLVSTQVTSNDSESDPKDQVTTASKPDQPSLINCEVNNSPSTKRKSIPNEDSDDFFSSDTNKNECTTHKAKVIDESSLRETANTAVTNLPVAEETIKKTVADADMSDSLKLASEKNDAHLSNENIAKKQEFLPSEVESKLNIVGAPHFRSERLKSFLDIDDTDDIFETFEKPSDSSVKAGTHAKTGENEEKASLGSGEENYVSTKGRHASVMPFTGASSTVEGHDDVDSCPKLTFEKKELDVKALSSDAEATREKMQVNSPNGSAIDPIETMNASRGKPQNISGDNEELVFNQHGLLGRHSEDVDENIICTQLEASPELGDTDGVNDNSSSIDQNLLLKDNAGSCSESEIRSNINTASSVDKSLVKQNGAFDEEMSCSVINEDAALVNTPDASKIQPLQAESAFGSLLHSLKPSIEFENAASDSSSATIDQAMGTLRKSPAGNVTPPNQQQLASLLRTRYKSFLDVDETDDIFECFDNLDARENSSALHEVDLSDSSFVNTSEKYRGSRNKNVTDSLKLKQGDTPGLPRSENMKIETHNNEQESVRESETPEILEIVHDSEEKCTHSSSKEKDCGEGSSRSNDYSHHDRNGISSSNQAENTAAKGEKIIPLDYHMRNLTEEMRLASLSEKMMNCRNKIFSNNEISQNPTTCAPSENESVTSLAVEKHEDSLPSVGVSKYEISLEHKRVNKNFDGSPVIGSCSNQNIFETKQEQELNLQDSIYDEHIVKTVRQPSASEINLTSRKNSDTKHESTLIAHHPIPNGSKEHSLIVEESGVLNARHKSFLDIDESDDIFDCFENSDRDQSDLATTNALEETTLNKPHLNNTEGADKIPNGVEEDSSVKIASTGLATIEATNCAPENNYVIESNRPKHNENSREFSSDIDSSDCHDNSPIPDQNESSNSGNATLMNLSGDTTNVSTQHVMRSASGITTNVLDDFRKKLFKYSLSQAKLTNDGSHSIGKDKETASDCLPTDQSLGNYSPFNNTLGASYSRSSVEKPNTDTEETITLMDVPRLQVNGTPQQLDENDDFFDYFENFTPEENCSARDVCVDNCQPMCSNCTKPGTNEKFDSPNYSNSTLTYNPPTIPSGEASISEHERVTTDSFLPDNFTYQLHRKQLDNVQSKQHGYVDMTLDSSNSVFSPISGCNTTQLSSEVDASKTNSSTPKDFVLAETRDTAHITGPVCEDGAIETDIAPNLNTSDSEAQLVEATDNPYCCLDAPDHLRISGINNTDHPRRNDGRFLSSDLASRLFMENKDESDSFSLLDGNEIKPKKFASTDETSNGQQAGNPRAAYMMVDVSSSEDPFEYFDDPSKESITNESKNVNDDRVKKEILLRDVGDHEEETQTININTDGRSEKDNLDLNEKLRTRNNEANQNTEHCRASKAKFQDDQKSEEKLIINNSESKEIENFMRGTHIRTYETSINRKKISIEDIRNEPNGNNHEERVKDVKPLEMHFKTGESQHGCEELKHHSKKIEVSNSEHDETSAVEKKSLTQCAAKPRRRSGAPFLSQLHDSDRKLIAQSHPNFSTCAEEVSATLENLSNRATCDGTSPENDELGVHRDDSHPDNIEMCRSEFVIPPKPLEATSWERAELTECVGTKYPVPPKAFVATAWERPELAKCLGTKSFVIQPTTVTKHPFTVNKVAFYSNVMTSSKPPRKYSSNREEGVRKVSTGAIPRILGLMKKQNSDSSLIEKLRPTRSVIYAPTKSDKNKLMRRSKSAVVRSKQSTFFGESKAHWKNITQKLEDSNRTITKSVEKLYASVSNSFSESDAAKSQSTDDIKTCGESNLSRPQSTVRKQKKSAISIKRISKPSMSASYEMLQDTDEEFGKCYQKPDPNLPPYCHARKSLFPNVSTSDLSNLERYDENFTPRSLALGKPTIVLQTWRERQKIDEPAVRPSHSTSDLTAMFRDKIEPSSASSATVGRSVTFSPVTKKDTPSPSTPIDQYKEDSGDGHLRHEERIQKDRSIDVYPETLRQRQRNMAPSPSKVDIKNWSQNEMPVRESSSPSEGKKFLPSVKALRSQFETGKSPNNGSSNGSVSPASTFSNSSNGSGTVSAPSKPSNRGDSTNTLSRKLSGSSLASSSLEKSSSNTSLNSAPSSENLLDGELTNEPVEPIFCQFQKVDEELRELMSRPTSTTGWDPRLVLKRLYYIPEMPRAHTKGNSCVNIEGFLEKLPSGRKKATFWNAWKKRYFVAKDGVLYYYQNSQCDKPSLRLTLMGGKVETMEANMVGVDDGKGHYVVMRCSSKSEAERWRKALETHLVEDFASQYVQPQPMTTNPTLLRDTLIIDIGSCSIRAGVLASQASLPQVFFPTVLATDRESRRQYWGPEALSPEVRSSSSISFPIRPSHRISKYSVDLTAVSSLLSKVFSELKVDPRNYNLQISVPRVLNQHTQSELIKILFEKFGVKGVNITHQSILALYAYNATSGIVVDIGERMDIVPVTDGYIIDGGVSRVPYGGYRILDHLRQFLHMRNVSLVNDVESYIIRHVLEAACYCAQHYNTEKARCSKNPENFEKSVSLKEFFSNLAQCPYENVELDFGRFQATEGLFNPDAWGLDHPGLHKLVHKAIQECSMDIRKEMSRSIFLAGGVTQLPGLADRLTAELDNLTPPAIRPKVHVSPYRYHAAFIGACTLAESAAFGQSVVTKENWLKNGNAALRKWAL